MMRDGAAPVSPFSDMQFEGGAEAYCPISIYHVTMKSHMWPALPPSRHGTRDSRHAPHVDADHRQVALATTLPEQLITGTSPSASPRGD
jgi:hypothetical protein